MDGRNKASLLNSGRMRDKRIIDAIIANHFEMFVGDVNNETLNKVNSRKSFDNEFVVFMSIVMEGNMGARIRVDTGSGNNRPAKIASDVFRDDRRIAVIGLGVNVEAVAVIAVNSGFN